VSTEKKPGSRTAARAAEPARTPAAAPAAAADGAPARHDRIRDLRFDGGGLALDLMATLGRRAGPAPVERLDGLPALRAWCEGVGLRVPGEQTEGPAGEHLLADLRLLREAMYDVAVSDLRGSGPALPSVALVNECAHHALPPPRLATEPELTAEPAPLTGRQLCSLAARDLIALMGDAARRSRLRTCEAAPCGMLYLDDTAGGRRRWCSMRTCGNRAKAARHRSRSAASTAR
jgi:predicted RNA-binding Zn ribbon-like protein